jgi:lipopolysaccharide export system permease protein
MENLDDFIDQDVPGSIILEYYLVFTPEIIRLMFPVGILLSALFTVGKLSNLNEITALKASSVSLYRFIIPFLVTSFVVSLFLIYFGGYVVPTANKQKVYIEQTFMKKGIVHAGSNIFFQDSEYRIVTITYFDVRTEQANRISIQEFDKNDITKMVSRIDAPRMKFDSTNQKWIAYNGVKRTFGTLDETADYFVKLEINNLHFKPDEVIKKQRKPEEMTLSELDDYSKDQLRAGNNPNPILIEYHSRIAFSFACFVVVLFGIPISASKRKGGLAIQFGISLLITFVYLVFMRVSYAFGKNGVMNPILTAWLANSIFFATALFNIYRARK